MSDVGEILVQVGPLKKVIGLSSLCDNAGMKQLERLIRDMAKNDASLQRVLGESCITFQTFNSRFCTWVDMGPEDKFTNGMLVQTVIVGKNFSDSYNNSSEAPKDTQSCSTELPSVPAQTMEEEAVTSALSDNEETVKRFKGSENGAVTTAADITSNDSDGAVSPPVKQRFKYSMEQPPPPGIGKPEEEEHVAVQPKPRSQQKNVLNVTGRPLTAVAPAARNQHLRVNPIAVQAKPSVTVRNIVATGSNAGLVGTSARTKYNPAAVAARATYSPAATRNAVYAARNSHRPVYSTAGAAASNHIKAQDMLANGLAYASPRLRIPVPAPLLNPKPGGDILGLPMIRLPPRPQPPLPLGLPMARPLPRDPLAMAMAVELEKTLGRWPPGQLHIPPF